MCSFIRHSIISHSCRFLWSFWRKCTTISIKYNLRCCRLTHNARSAPEHIHDTPVAGQSLSQRPAATLCQCTCCHCCYQNTCKFPFVAMFYDLIYYQNWTTNSVTSRTISLYTYDMSCKKISDSNFFSAADVVPFYPDSPCHWHSARDVIINST